MISTTSINRVLITGISGFVGPHLAKSYVDQGVEVFGLVRRRADGDVARGLREVGIENQVKKLEGNVEDLTSLLMAFDVSQPDIVFHLAAQSFVQRSFSNPLECMTANATGTANILEAMRLKTMNGSRLVFAGSSEEYGFVVLDEKQKNKFEAKKGKLFPQPERIPELPIKETNPLRPMSPYAVTKVFGELMTLEYSHSYGLKNVVSRGFNHEGARRGSYFVTSTIARQVSTMIFNNNLNFRIGNLSAFRDWTHVDDMVDGYRLLANDGESGEVYNLCSERTNSVLGYLLTCLLAGGLKVRGINSWHSQKKVKNPTEEIEIRMFGKKWLGMKVEKMMLDGDIDFDIEDGGLDIDTDKGIVKVEFDPTRFRPTDVPILLGDSTKAKALGFKPKRKLEDIVRDQLNYYADPVHRSVGA